MKYILFTVIGFGESVRDLLFGERTYSPQNEEKTPVHTSYSYKYCFGTACNFHISRGVYLNIHYSADNEVAAVFANSRNIKVNELDNAFFVDGEGEDTAFIFYPGAKVDSEAYLPLMKSLPLTELTASFSKLPFRMAIFDVNASDKTINDYNYKSIIVSGHLMGGVAASSYASSNTDNIDGVVLLAAYPTSKISDSTPLLSIYGSEDKVLQKDAYNNAVELPYDFEEVVIAGGNHAYYGNYGEQSGDGKATITREKQQDDTVSAIVAFAKGL